MATFLAIYECAGSLAGWVAADAGRCSERVRQPDHRRISTRAGTLDFRGAAGYYLVVMHKRAMLGDLPARPGVEETASLWGGTMVVWMRPVPRLDAEQLAAFCSLNRDLRIEQTAKGELVIMAPAGWDSGNKEAEITAKFVVWAERHGGRVGGANAGYTLPNKAVRAPDVSWISEERFATLTPDQLKSFAPICPDFVLELRSRTDRLAMVKRKMVEYIDNGARLGWLIDPLKKQVFIYRPGEPVEHLENPLTLSGEPVLAGFTLDLTRVW